MDLIDISLFFYSTDKLITMTIIGGNHQVGGIPEGGEFHLGQILKHQRPFALSFIGN